MKIIEASEEEIREAVVQWFHREIKEDTRILKNFLILSKSDYDSGKILQKESIAACLVEPLTVFLLGLRDDDEFFDVRENILKGAIGTAIEDKQIRAVINKEKEFCLLDKKALEIASGYIFPFQLNPKRLADCFKFAFNLANQNGVSLGEIFSLDKFFIELQRNFFTYDENLEKFTKFLVLTNINKYIDILYGDELELLDKDDVIDLYNELRLGIEAIPQQKELFKLRKKVLIKLKEKEAERIYGKNLP